MIDLIKLGGYLLIGLITARIVLTICYRVWRRERQQQGAEFGDEAEYLMAILAGILWPVVLGAGLVYALFAYVLGPITKPTALRRDERRERDQAERARAAEQAKTFDLPMPPDDTTGGTEP